MEIENQPRLKNLNLKSNLTFNIYVNFMNPSFSGVEGGSGL